MPLLEVLQNTTVSQSVVPQLQAAAPDLLGILLTANLQSSDK